jgi:hypothetical protein
MGFVNKPLNLFFACFLRTVLTQKYALQLATDANKMLLLARCRQIPVLPVQMVYTMYIQH